MSSRPLLLDLYCGVGGAAKGYHDAGFDVVGVDKYLQKNYPYPYQPFRDVPTILHNLVHNNGDILGHKLSDFTAIHASPPCQCYSLLADRHWQLRNNPDLIGVTRDLLVESGLPYIIENVPFAPLIKSQTILLCGVLFHRSHGLRVIRHRKFESSASVTLTELPHMSRWDHPLVATLDWRKNHYKKLDENDPSTFVTVTGKGANCSVATARDAMQIPWAKIRLELNEAVPPPYTEYVGKQVIAQCR